VARAASILRRVALERNGSTAKEIAAGAGLPLPTAYHLLATLTDEGLLAKDDRRYRLGPGVGVLAEAFRAHVSAPATLMEHVRDLAEVTGDTAYLSAWRDNDALVLSIADGHRAVRVAGLHPGYSGGAHVRASGKVLLAFGPPGTLAAYLRTHDLQGRAPDALEAELQLVRGRGYALDEEQFADGVACIAAPVADGGMAIGISTPAQRFREQRRELIEAVRAVAARGASPQLARLHLRTPETGTAAVVGTP
jgi:DNA-binding IclR family transcriptional regulator